MNIIAATQDYEAWLAEQTHVHAPELDYKHALMADKKDPFPFFRGTYYRWAKQWHQAGEPWNACRGARDRRRPSREFWNMAGFRRPSHLGSQ